MRSLGYVLKYVGGKKPPLGSDYSRDIFKNYDQALENARGFWETDEMVLKRFKPVEVFVKE